MKICNNTFIIFIVLSILIISCSKQDETLSTLKTELDIAIETLSKENTTGDIAQLQPALVNYANYILLDQQEIQSQDPKKLNNTLLMETIQLIDENVTKYPQLQTIKYLQVMKATMNMLIAAYSNAKSDLVKAVEHVQIGFEIFDELEALYPDDMSILCYRINNYSSLPELFGKKPEVLENIAILFTHINTTTALPVFEKQLYITTLDRIEKYLQNEGEDSSEMASLKEKINAMSNADMSLSVINN